MFWVGPFSGAILAAAIYEGFFRDRTDAVRIASIPSIAVQAGTVYSCSNSQGSCQRVHWWMQTFDTPEDQDTEGEAPAGKMSLPAFSGMRGQQEKSSLPDQNKGMAGPALAHNGSAGLDTVV